MTENAFTLPADKPHSFQGPRAFNAILYGGLAVGVLDGLAAVILTLLHGRSPSRMFQGIAKGLIGDASFNGGWATVLLGMSLHFLIAFIWATIYYGASVILPTLIFAMQLIVLPLSAIRKPPFYFVAPLQGIIVHIVCVGLPIAFFAWRSAEKTER